MQWLAKYSDTISALTGLGMLMVWVIYLQVFVSSYRRQLRATLLITRGPGSGVEARCFLSNMSSGPVYIASVQVQIETAGGVTIRPVTDAFDPRTKKAAVIRERTRQGPLGEGETRDIGSFQELIEDASCNSSATQHLRSVVIEVVGLYGSEDLPVGASRCFVVFEDNEELYVQGKNLQTEQIRKRRDRRKLLTDLKRDP